MTTRRLLLALPVLAAPLAAPMVAPMLAPLAPRPAAAQGSPAQVVEGFHAALLGVMRDAQRLGVRGRFERLAPAMGQAFDLAAMTRISVGPPWNTFSPPEQQALAEAFARWSVATYAARFDGFSGESFATQGVQALPNGDALVRTVLNRPGGQEPVVLSYLVRGGRIVDIYLTGTISELASRRSEFTGLVREGGAARLAAELNSRAQRLLAG
ncbi:ABC transporter substrate-binding protein [Roseococcus sp. DSY-14]|uniref:ABC transporter substrate-binding protein n=1 Tax=Roseococcus sp. DSY-14 TaxID=3369650 RepID=UPI00387AC93D